MPSARRCRCRCSTQIRAVRHRRAGALHRRRRPVCSRGQPGRRRDHRRRADADVIFGATVDPILTGRAQVILVITGIETEVGCSNLTSSSAAAAAQSSQAGNGDARA